MIYRFDDVVLDTDRFELRRSGVAISVEPQVFELLAYLMANSDRLVTRDELLRSVWGNVNFSDATLSSRVMSARQVIGDNGQQQRLIKTVRGRGFRFAFPEEQLAVAGPSQMKASQPSTQIETPVLEQDIGYCTTSDGVTICYGVTGDGPPIVRAANWLTHIENDLNSSVWGHWWRLFSAGHQLVRYDRRGSGLSDRDVGAQSLEAWVRDLEAVVDHLELERFVLAGLSQGGAVALKYALAHPERLCGLILHGSFARGWKRWGPASSAEFSAMISLVRAGWERDNPSYRQMLTSKFLEDSDQASASWFTDFERMTSSADNSGAVLNALAEYDLIPLLGEITAPSIVFHSDKDPMIRPDLGRQIAAAIPNSRLVILRSRNHLVLENEPAWQVISASVAEFLDSTDRRTNC